MTEQKKHTKNIEMQLDIQAGEDAAGSAQTCRRAWGQATLGVPGCKTTGKDHS